MDGLEDLDGDLGRRKSSFLASPSLISRSIFSICKTAPNKTVTRLAFRNENRSKSADGANTYPAPRFRVLKNRLVALENSIWESENIRSLARYDVCVICRSQR